MTTRFVANFASPEGRWRGLGFFLDAAGRRIAAPVTRLDFALAPKGAQPKGHGRLVMLNFEPEPGYWASEDGRSLIREMALHAARGPALLWVEVPRASVHDDESAGVVVHVQDRRAPGPEGGRVRLDLLRDGQGRWTRGRSLASAGSPTSQLTFAGAESPGLYAVRALYERGGGIVDAHETGFWRRDPALLAGGSTLTAGKTYLRRDGKPFLVVGVNHWVNDAVWPYFPENGNALEWDRDFAEMASRDLNFVRTGNWFDRLLLVDRPTGGAREAVLRNLEALLLAAGRHGLHVQFTFFSFEPGSLMRSLPEGPAVGTQPLHGPRGGGGRRRPSCARSSPASRTSPSSAGTSSTSRASRTRGPSGGGTSRTATRRRSRPGTSGSGSATGRKRRSPRPGVSSRRTCPPSAACRSPRRRTSRSRATGTRGRCGPLDYNLFAQDAFGRWVGQMVDAIRSTGSRQLVAVGQDEGGVTGRLLNQFYGGAGVDMTSMHNWWQDDALLWDAVAAKRPGVPNLVGETSPQPAVAMDGRSRWDETGGLALLDRKLALGMAAGNAGVAAWIWSRSDPYHVGRPDGSSTLWLDRLTELARFAKEAEPHLADARPSDVVHRPAPVAAAVGPRALRPRGAAAGDPRPLPRGPRLGRGGRRVPGGAPRKPAPHHSPLAVGPRRPGLGRAPREGAGRRDPAGHGPHRSGRALPADREDAGDRLSTTSRRSSPPASTPCAGRAERDARSSPGTRPRISSRPFCPAGRPSPAARVGRGQVLFFTLPLELNDDLRLLGDVYRWALAEAKVEPVYRTALDDPGILICPAPLETGTLYVLTSESPVEREVRFRDVASGRDLRVDLAPGRAALLLVTRTGEVVD